MYRVVVSVKREGDGYGRDLELPAELPIGQLTQLLTQNLGWLPGTYQLHAFPPGRVLEEHETLASAGVWDGAWLIARVAAPVPR